MSWRDTTSKLAQDELDNLLNVALGFAQRQLSEHGAFFPYAAAISIKGAPEMIASRPSESHVQPHADDILVSCFSTLTDRREVIRAGAVVSDVRVLDGGDAIRVDLEHSEGVAIVALLPYTRANKQIRYGNIQALVGQRQIWA